MRSGRLQMVLPKLQKMRDCAFSRVLQHSPEGKRDVPDGVHLRADNSLRSKIRPGHGGSGLTANTLLVQHLMHEGDRNRSLADGRCDAFDIAASDVADSEHSGQARFEQMRIPEQRPMRSHQVFF